MYADPRTNDLRHVAWALREEQELEENRPGRPGKTQYLADPLRCLLYMVAYGTVASS